MDIKRFCTAMPRHAEAQLHVGVVEVADEADGEKTGEKQHTTGNVAYPAVGAIPAKGRRLHTSAMTR